MSVCFRIDFHWKLNSCSFSFFLEPPVFKGITFENNRFRAEFSGNPKPDTTWHLDGKILDNVTYEKQGLLHVYSSGYPAAYACGTSVTFDASVYNSKISDKVELPSKLLYEILINPLNAKILPK